MLLLFLSRYGCSEARQFARKWGEPGRAMFEGQAERFGGAPGLFEQDLIIRLGQENEAFIDSMLMIQNSILAELKEL